MFDRDESYDPRVDSIVRVEAGRLRTKLEQYYHGHGSDDPIVIRLQKGTYAPTFERRAPQAGAQAPAAPPAESFATSSSAATLAAAVPRGRAAPCASPGSR